MQVVVVGVYVVKLWFRSLLADVIWCSCGLLMVQHVLTTLYHGQLLWFSVLCMVVVVRWFSVCSARVGRIVWGSSRLLIWRSCWRHEFIWSVHWLSCQWYVC